MDKKEQNGNIAKPALNEVCRFGDIGQEEFFIYEGIKLC